MKVIKLLAMIAVQIICVVMAVRAGWHGDWAQGCFWLAAEISATLTTLSERVGRP